MSRARLKLFALVLASGMALQVSAQQAPAEVTDREIAKYKTVADAACREGGKKKGDADLKVDAFCACLMAHLNKSMTRIEWQQVYYYSETLRADEEREVLTPHLKTFKGCQPAS